MSRFSPRRVFDPSDSNDRLGTTGFKSNPTATSYRKKKSGVNKNFEKTFRWATPCSGRLPVLS